MRVLRRPRIKACRLVVHLKPLCPTYAGEVLNGLIVHVLGFGAASEVEKLAEHHFFSFAGLFFEPCSATKPRRGLLVIFASGSGFIVPPIRDVRKQAFDNLAPGHGYQHQHQSVRPRHSLSILARIGGGVRLGRTIANRSYRSV